MKLKPAATLTDINKGDQLLINGYWGSGEYGIRHHIVQTVKVSESDGTEIILKGKGNCYFNLGMYLAGESWVKEVNIVVDDLNIEQNA